MLCAGTGCGWCRPYLVKLWEAAAAEGDVEPDLPTAADYARERSKYVRAGGGKPPPGATPIEPDEANGWHAVTRSSAGRHGYRVRLGDLKRQQVLVQVLPLLLLGCP